MPYFWPSHGRRLSAGAAAVASGSYRLAVYGGSLLQKVWWEMIDEKRLDEWQRLAGQALGGILPMSAYQVAPSELAELIRLARLGIWAENACAEFAKGCRPECAHQWMTPENSWTRCRFCGQTPNQQQKPIEGFHGG